MGGSKVSTKIGIIENLMDKVDNLILCGGMTYTFAKAQGGKIGKSIVEDDKLDLALDIIKKAKEKGVNLILGTDCVAAVEATDNGAFSLVGGGDSVACVNKFGLADQVSYVSTGGGALLEAIEGKVLPGVAAVKG